MTDTIRILLIDDQTTIRQALKVLLEQEPDFQIVGSADSGQKGLEQVEALKPDIALVDILMPGMDGIATTKAICQRFSKTKVLVLSGHDHGNYLSEAFRAGAKGYLLKNTPAEDLANAIRSVHKGYGQVSPGLLEKVVTQSAGSESPVSNSNSRSELDFAPTDIEQGPSEAELLLLLKSFDVKGLSDTVQRVVKQGNITQLLNRLSQYLKSDPTNLSALYLSGALARRSPQHQQSAMQYLRFGFKQGVKQGLSRENLLRFYQEGASLNPKESFNWLIQVDSPWNSKAGLSFLSQEAIRRFGPDSVYVQTVMTLYRIRTIRMLSNRCISLGSQLERLRQGFERLNGVMKQ